MVKHICWEDYKAAANSALKFHPLRREIVKSITGEVKKELRTYSKGTSMAKYNGNPLSLKYFKSENLLQEISDRLPITHAIITGSSNSSDSVKFLKTNEFWHSLLY